LKKEAEKKEI